MKADRFLTLYERVVDAPAAADRLRRFVLDLAVRGKLVEQDSGDEPASALLERIAAEKARLMRAGKLRRRRTPPRFGEPPFALPANWRWSRIGDFASDRGQRVPDRPFTYIDVSAIDKKAGLVADPRVLEPSEAPSRARKLARSGDVVYSCVRPYLLNVAIIEDDYDPPPIASTAFEVLNGHGLVLPRYTWIVLRSSFMIACVEHCQRGQAYPAINSTDFAVLPFPLPPLAEQHRIVAKFDELMVLCGRLDETRAARESTRDRLTNACYARLSATETDSATFQSHTRFNVGALPALTARANQVKHLRETILNLAVQGKLVEQDPADEPASKQLERIAEEKAKLVLAGNFREFKAHRSADGASFPFPIPARWIWCHLDDLAAIARGGSPRPIKAYVTDDPDGIPWIKIGDSVRDSIYINQTSERIRPEGVTKSRLVRRGDLLLSNSMSFGFPYIMGIEGCIHDGWLVIRTPERLVDKLFLHALFRSGHAQRTFAKSASGAVVRNLNTEKVRLLPVPLPPLAEQHRIVAKVDELMALCDRIEAALAATNAARSELVESLLHDALQPPHSRPHWPNEHLGAGLGS